LAKQFQKRRFLEINQPETRIAKILSVVLIRLFDDV
jgi:hypothetical protein